MQKVVCPYCGRVAKYAKAWQDSAKAQAYQEFMSDVSQPLQAAGYWRDIDG